MILMDRAWVPAVPLEAFFLNELFHIVFKFKVISFQRVKILLKLNPLKTLNLKNYN